MTKANSIILGIFVLFLSSCSPKEEQKVVAKVSPPKPTLEYKSATIDSLVRFTWTVPNEMHTLVGYDWSPDGSRYRFGYRRSKEVFIVTIENLSNIPIQYIGLPS